MKRPVDHVLLAFGSAFLTGFSLIVIAFLLIEGKIVQQKQQGLTTLLDAKSEILSNTFEGYSRDLAILAANPRTTQAFRALSRGFERLGDNRIARLQTLYISKNTYPLGEKSKLVDPSDGSLYSNVHRRYHLHFRQYLQNRGYGEIYLIDQRGNVIYSVNKGWDFGTNLQGQPWGHTPLAKAYQAASQPELEPETQFFYDFTAYAAINGEGAAFIAQPLVDRNQTVGALVLRMPISDIEQINDKLSVRLGETGEFLLVGSDRLLRNSARLLPENTSALKKEIKLDAVTEALSGRRGASVERDYRFLRTVVAYSPISYAGVNWAMIAKQDLSESNEPAWAISVGLALAVLPVILLVTFIGYVMDIKLSPQKPAKAAEEEKEENKAAANSEEKTEKKAQDQPKPEKKAEEPKAEKPPETAKQPKPAASATENVVDDGREAVAMLGGAAIAMSAQAQSANESDDPGIDKDKDIAVGGE